MQDSVQNSVLIRQSRDWIGSMPSFAQALHNPSTETLQLHWKNTGLDSDLTERGGGEHSHSVCYNPEHPCKLDSILLVGRGKLKAELV